MSYYSNVTDHNYSGIMQHDIDDDVWLSLHGEDTGYLDHLDGVIEDRDFYLRQDFSYFEAVAFQALEDEIEAYETNRIQDVMDLEYDFAS